MESKKAMILKTIFIVIILSNIILSIILGKYIIFLLTILFILVIEITISYLESKKMFYMAKKFLESYKYQEGIEYFKKLNGKLIFNNIVCLGYLSLFYLYNDNAIETKKILMENPKIKKFPEMFYPQFIFAIAENNQEEIIFYSNKIFSMKNKTYKDQQENTKKILAMIENKEMNIEVYEKTRIPLLKKICLTYNTTADEITFPIDDLNLNNENIEVVKPIATKSIMKFIKIVLNILTCLSIFIALIIFSIVNNKVEVINEMEGMYYSLKNIWIFYLFLPIPITNFVFGKYLKSNNYKYISNLILGSFFSIFLFIFGSMTFIRNRDFSTDKSYLYNIETMIEMDFPDDFSIITNSLSSKDLKHPDNIQLKYESVVRFNNEIELDNMNSWQTSLNYNNFIPYIFFIQTTNYEYFMIYCIDTKEINPNTYHTKNNYYVIAYDKENSNLLIYEYYIK